MHEKSPKILCIVGPTASGKSALAVALAKKFGGEVISADSRQVYRGLDIGTGKITKREMRGVKHYLLDVASPKKKFTASDYLKRGRKAIKEIEKRKKLPIIAGGTGFYIDALLGRIVLPDVPPNEKLRARLEKQNTEKLLALLKEKDPQRAETIEPHHKRRIIRALEIAKHLGTVPAPSAASNATVLWIGIDPTLPVLEKKIRARLISRLKGGMLAEAKRLHKAGLSYKRMEELGLEYRSMAQHLQRKTTKEETIEELSRDIRRYAKKQIAYWKRNTEIRWFKPGDKKIEHVVQKWFDT